MSGTGLTGQVAMGTATISIPGGRDRDADLATIRAAADAGVRIFDAARAYAPVGDPLYSERLLADALAGRDVMIGTKGGHWRVSETEWAVENSPERLRRDVDDSLRALGVERIDLYYIHRVDDLVIPIEEGVEALEELRRAGKIARIGVSNATADQIDRAASVGEISAVQNMFSLARLWSPLSRDEVLASLARCEAHGIALFGYSPLRWDGGTELPAAFPRTAAIAAARGVSVQRLLLRGLLGESAAVSLVSGATRAESITDAARAMTTEWDEDLAAAWAEDRATS